jgi:DNA-binding CsgD family transcriptional regulator
MNDEVILVSGSQYIAGGDVETAGKKLVEGLQRNLITCWPLYTDEQILGEVPFTMVQLYSQPWGMVGRIELEPVDPTQTLVHICLQEYPNEQETAAYEQEVREALPPPATTIRLMDVEGDRQRALAYLARCLQEFRIRRLREILYRMVTSMQLISVDGLSFKKQAEPTGSTLPTTSPQRRRNGKGRDIPHGEMVLRIDQQELLRLWQAGHTAKEIALRTSKTEKTILNQLTLLRKSLGEEQVPRRR